MVCFVRSHPIYVDVGFSFALAKGWVIDLDVHGLLDGPSDTMCLPAYDGEAVHTDGISHGQAVLVDQGGGS